MMAPFTIQHSNGKASVNTIRIVEQLIGTAVGACIILYGGYMVLGEKVDNATARIDAASIAIQEHVKMDSQKQADLHEWMMQQNAIVTKHETIMKQEGLMK